MVKKHEERRVIYHLGLEMPIWQWKANGVVNRAHVSTGEKRIRQGMFFILKMESLLLQQEQLIFSLQRPYSYCKVLGYKKPSSSSYSNFSPSWTRHQSSEFNCQAAASNGEGGQPRWL
ncbi:hypothetical protein Dimus_031880, partial [Dionaea muscipula]